MYFSVFMKPGHTSANGSDCCGTAKLSGKEDSSTVNVQRIKGVIVMPLLVSTTESNEHPAIRTVERAQLLNSFTKKMPGHSEEQPGRAFPGCEYSLVRVLFLKSLEPGRLNRRGSFSGS